MFGFNLFRREFFILLVFGMFPLVSLASFSGAGGTL